MNNQNKGIQLSPQQIAEIAGVGAQVLSDPDLKVSLKHAEAVRFCSQLLTGVAAGQLVLNQAPPPPEVKEVEAALEEVTEETDAA